MKKKLKLTFDQLEKEMELEGSILSTPMDLSAVMGGGSTIDEMLNYFQSLGFIFERGSDGNYYGNQNITLDTVTVSASYKYNGQIYSYTNPFNLYYDWTNLGGSGGYNNNSGGGGGEGNGNLSTTVSVLGLSTQNGLAWQEFYVNANKLANGNLNTNITSIMKDVFHNSTSLKSDVLSLISTEGYQGIKIVDSAGKILGIAGVVDSSVNLYNDIMNGGDFSWMNLADFGVNIGSLAIKSNIVGFSISAGWLVVKSYFDSENN